MCRWRTVPGKKRISLIISVKLAIGHRTFAARNLRDLPAHGGGMPHSEMIRKVAYLGLIIVCRASHFRVWQITKDFAYGHFMRLQFSKSALNIFCVEWTLRDQKESTRSFLRHAVVFGV